MEKVIWKYIITYEKNKYEMPKGAKILSVQEQNGQICLWVLVEPDAEREIRIIEIAGTGLPIKIKESWIFIGTVQTDWFVNHIFEIK
jgi:hypothetical protein